MWTAIDPKSGFTTYIDYCDTEEEAREMLARAKDENLRDINRDLDGSEKREALRDMHTRFRRYRIVELTEEQCRIDRGEIPPKV